MRGDWTIPTIIVMTVLWAAWMVALDEIGASGISEFGAFITGFKIALTIIMVFALFALAFKSRRRDEWVK